jgi:methylenetetrahydrofolate dehydrogenase (NADP+) / methenyltetrahydrofolate cyclohydrolase
MKIDGKENAREIRSTLRQALATLETPVRVIVFAMSEDEVTKQYLGIKERVASELGVQLTVESLPKETTTEELVQSINDAALLCEGIIVQLPLSPHINAEVVRDALPKERDIDCLGTAAFEDFETGTGLIMPPVVAAFEHILLLHSIDLEGKKTVIIGQGRLVGKPAAIWFERQGAHVEICDEHTKDLSAHTKDADVIVLGAGVPGLLKPDMIKDGVVILDAGTSESSGKIVGDADPSCEEKAGLFTPVPGGIGPVAIAMLFSNLYTLATDTIDA